MKGSMILMLLLFSLLISVMSPISIYAVDTVPTEEFVQAWEERKSLPVESNKITNWPNGPEIGAESAVLMEVETGTILYAKNIDERLYPASITKMMTALLVVENTTMEEVVTFSREAIDNTEWGSSRIGIMKGEELTIEECLYGLLLGSANEVAYGLAEHVGGDLNTFVEMMNQRAQALGCTNTHFINASGLPDENHYVSAHDMALIAKEFFSNDTLCMISGSTSYTISPTNKTDEKRPMENHHKMVSGKKYEYEGIIGGKTGFTKDARQTLVTCAQKEGMKLICIVMKDESPYQFLDTQELFDYGFNGFSKLKISDYESRYNISSANFFHTNIDIMGSSKSILSLNENGYAIVPKNINFNDARVEVDYNVKIKNAVAKLNYFVGDNLIGSTTIDYAGADKHSFEFANIITDTGDESYTYEPEQKTIFITVSDIVKKVAIVLGILFVILVIIALIFGFIRSARRAQMKKKKRYKQRSENSHKNNYKKRSENKRRHEPVDNNKNIGKKYMKPLYQDLSKRLEDAAGSETINEYDEIQKQRERELYLDSDLEDTDDYEGFFDEQQMYDNFASTTGYGVELNPLDDPKRWE